MKTISKAISIIAGFAAMVSAAPIGHSQEPAFSADIEELTEQNTDFRRVLFTGRNLQVVAMTLRAGEDIGQEVHDVDQCFFFVEGAAQTFVEGSTAISGDDDVFCVSAGTRHNIRNHGREPLKLYTLYAPPEHPANTVHRTKADAQRAEQAQ